MITGVMMFAEPIDIGRFKETISQRLLRHERFRQRVRQPVLPLGLPRWETDPHFDLNAHVHRIALPQPGDMSALQELVGDMMSCALDPNKPLWHLYVVDNFPLPCVGIGPTRDRLRDGPRQAAFDVARSADDLAGEMRRCQAGCLVASDTVGRCEGNRPTPG
ncbi:MAG: wax ester/triacylglycerol synthase domain-containing protein [Anaerolineae bacterium]